MKESLLTPQSTCLNPVPASITGSEPQSGSEGLEELYSLSPSVLVSQGGCNRLP